MLRNRTRDRLKTVPLAIAVAAVLAKYPANAVTLYLPSNTLNTVGAPATLGNNIQTWNDTGGANNTATQTASGSQPTLQSVRGMNAVNFGGAAYMSMLQAAWPRGTDSFTMVGVNNSSAAESGGQYIFNPSGSGPDGALAYSGTVLAIWGGSSPGYNVGDTSVPVIATALRRSNVGMLRVNGVQRASASGLTGTGASTFGTIGAYQTNVNLSGNIWCALAINGTVSDADALTLERWFNTMTPTGVSF